MAHQLKVARGSVNRCMCGCGRRKNPRRRFAPGCGIIRHHRFRTKPVFDTSKNYTNQKRGDLIVYTGAQAIKINAEARAAERSTSLGAALRRGPKPNLKDKGDF